MVGSIRIISLLLALACIPACNSFFSRKVSYAAVVTPGQTPAALGCSGTITRKQWYVLYGSISLRRPAPETLFSRRGTKYFIREYTTGWDLFLSILIGSLTSLSRSTLEIQECPGPGSRPTPRMEKKPVPAKPGAATPSTKPAELPALESTKEASP